MLGKGEVSQKLSTKLDLSLKMTIKRYKLIISNLYLKELTLVDFLFLMTKLVR